MAYAVLHEVDTAVLSLPEINFHGHAAKERNMHLLTHLLSSSDAEDGDLCSAFRAPES